MPLSARTALEAIGTLPEAEIDIAAAALQLARIDAPDADWIKARTHLSLLARETVSAGAAVAAEDLSGRAAVLAEVLVQRHGYAGDETTYDDLANVNLIAVTERRRGMPVALGVLWLHCARAAGWAAHGLDFPGHFLVALPSGGRAQQLVLDPFHGGMPLDARDLRELIKRVEGSGAELRPGLLKPMTTRAVLLRLQNNIKARRLEAGDLPGALDCLEIMVLIAPEEPQLWREAALLNQRFDRVAAAMHCFERFLNLVPQGDAAARVRAAMDELRSRLN